MDIKINELTLSFPEGFRVLDEEERSHMNMIKNGEGEVLSDPERHILFSVAYKKANILTGMVKPAEAIISMEKQVSSPMKEFGYVCDGFFQEEVGDMGAEAFSYHYEAQGVKMNGESAILKYQKTFYYIHVYYRTELETESRKVIDEILRSASFGE